MLVRVLNLCWRLVFKRTVNKNGELFNMRMRRILTAIFTVIVTAARIGMGFSNSISGPTLLYLAANVQSDVSSVSYIFTGKSFGIVVGAIFGGLFKRLYPDNGQLMTLATSLGIMGAVTFAIPFIRTLWILVIDITIAGIMYGYLDAGLQALLLQIWGEAGSRAQIQLFHFTFSLGAFIAPIIVQPFLLMSDKLSSQSSSGTCPNIYNNGSSFVNTTTLLPQTHPAQQNFDPVGWVYIIGASWMVGISFIMLLMASFKVERKLSQFNGQSGQASEERLEEPIQDLIWVFIPVTGYFFCAVATESVFYNFIYPVTLCSGLKFTITNATFANSLFWMGLGAGRLTGVLAANRATPKQIITASIISSIIDSFLMVSLGETHAWIAWIVSFSHGYTTAMMYGSGVSWLSQITNVSGTYMFIFSIGNSLSGVFMLRLAGYIFNMHPFDVMLQVFVLSLVNGLFFALSLYAGKRHLIFLRRRRRSESSKPSGWEDDSNLGERANEPLLG